MYYRWAAVHGLWGMGWCEMWKNERDWENTPNWQNQYHVLTTIIVPHPHYIRNKHNFNYFHLLSNMRAWSNFIEILTKDCQSDIVPVAWWLIMVCYHLTSVHKLIRCGNAVDQQRGSLLVLKVSILAELVCYLASCLWVEFGGQVFRETVVVV